MTKTITKDGFKAVIDPVVGGFKVIICRWDGEQWNALYNQNRRTFSTFEGAEKCASARIAENVETHKLNQSY